MSVSVWVCAYKPIEANEIWRKFSLIFGNICLPAKEDLGKGCHAIPMWCGKAWHLSCEEGNLLEGRNTRIDTEKSRSMIMFYLCICVEACETSWMHE